MASRSLSHGQDTARKRITLLVACSLAAILAVAWISRPPAQSALTRKTPGPIADPPAAGLGTDIDWQVPEVYVPRSPDPTRLSYVAKRQGAATPDARIILLEPRVKASDPEVRPTDPNTKAEDPNTTVPDPNAKAVDPSTKAQDPNAARAAISAARAAILSARAAANAARAAAAKPVVVTPPPPPPPPPVLDIRGVVFSQEEPLVIVGTEVLHEGDSVGSVKIVKIRMDSVDLQDETRTWTQSLVE